MTDHNGGHSGRTARGRFGPGNSEGFKSGQTGNRHGTLPERVLPIVSRALSMPMPRDAQVDFVMAECKVTRDRAESYLTRGRKRLELRRLNGDDERDEQLERIRRAMAMCLTQKRMAAYASLEAVYARVAGTAKAMTVDLGSNEDGDGPTEFVVRVVGGTGDAQ